MRILLFLALLPALAPAQTCLCCKKLEKGQIAYNQGDYSTALARWQEGLKLSDAANCPELPGLIKKAEKAIQDARKRDLAAAAARKKAESDAKIPDNQPSDNPKAVEKLPIIPSDRDKDGIADKDDQCPDTAGIASLRGCPDLKDDDEDGTPNAQDDCPTTYGPKQYRGCPDRDFDETPDIKDACPDQPGPKNTAGCPDRDADGVADKDDLCPDQAGPKTLSGCPDRDNDGTADKDDQCPDAAGPQRFNGCPDTDFDETPDQKDDCPDAPGPKRFNGCPDKDGDETSDLKDGCPDTPGPKTAYGCPDRDADGVADKDDQCPDQFGAADNKGCSPPPPAWMAKIPGGTYTMGDLFGNGNETQHAVTLSDFYMGKTEVTFDEFDAFCTATSRGKPYGSSWGRDQRPVIYVDWYDAVEYCNWLSQEARLTPAYTIDKTRQDPNNQNKDDTQKYTVAVNWAANGYRLPTEAEWEFAAREGGKKVRFGNGKDIADPTQINFDASKEYKKDYSVVGEYRQKTVPVNEMTGAVNSLGLRHMSGNVYEWCQDWYGGSYYSESNGATDPKGPGSGEYRVVRGGSWSNDPFNGRSANRVSRWPYSRNGFIGFRVVRHL